MEEICREMNARGMNTPLLIGGATTSAVHTAVKLAPLYDHVFYGPDASAAAVLAKKCMMDRETFEAEQHTEQKRLRDIYNSAEKMDSAGQPEKSQEASEKKSRNLFATDSYITECPSDIPVSEIPVADVLPYFDWKMFYAIWGVKYGSAVPEAMELMQLRRDAEEELALEDFRIMLTAKFFPACCKDEDICFEANVRKHLAQHSDNETGEPTTAKEVRIPMMRQEGGKGLSLCDFVIPASSTEEQGRKGSVFGMFAISVHKKSKAHVQGCSCPACSNAYEDMIGRTVRMTLAEAASKWLDTVIKANPALKVTKPAAGYASCPDHTLKGDILKLLGVMEGEVHQHEHCDRHHDDGHHHHEHGHHHPEHGHEHHHGHECGCCGHSTDGMGISLTESYAMTPESSICGFIFIHPEASYPDIRKLSKEMYDEYASRRGMDEERARRFLGHLLK
jgi:5-methyltetrahydrofolate--homocysteine methyltransferase